MPEVRGRDAAFPGVCVLSGLDLVGAAKFFKPTILLGLSARAGLFTEQLIREVAKHCERPFIFPLSNPTSSAECTAEQAYTWTDNKCVFASGSPFPPYVTPTGRLIFNGTYVHRRAHTTCSLPAARWIDAAPLLATNSLHCRTRFLSGWR